MQAPTDALGRLAASNGSLVGGAAAQILLVTVREATPKRIFENSAETTGALVRRLFVAISTGTTDVLHLDPKGHQSIIALHREFNFSTDADGLQLVGQI
jgi:hypothetical protein